MTFVWIVKKVGPLTELIEQENLDNNDKVSIIDYIQIHSWKLDAEALKGYLVELKEWKLHPRENQSIGSFRAS